MRKTLRLMWSVALALSVLAGLGYVAHRLNPQSDRAMADRIDGVPYP